MGVAGSAMLGAGLQGAMSAGQEWGTWWKGVGTTALVSAVTAGAFQGVNLGLQSINL